MSQTEVAARLAESPHPVFTANRRPTPALLPTLTLELKKCRGSSFVLGFHVRNSSHRPTQKESCISTSNSLINDVATYGLILKDFKTV